MLTQKQTQFYSKLETTFLSDGWELIVQGWKNERDSIPEAAFFNAQTMEDIRVARVRYGLLSELIDLPATIEQQKLNVEAENSE